MKHNTIKKVLSLLLVICMTASFAGCVPGEEDPTEPSSSETAAHTENTTAPTDGTTVPNDRTDATINPILDDFLLHTITDEREVKILLKFWRSGVK